MRKSISGACLAGTLMLLSVTPAAAQEAESTLPSRPRPVESSIGFDLLTGRIQEVAAEQAGTGTRAWGGQLTGAVTAFRVLTLGAELGIVDMADEDAFTQETTEGEKTSSVSSFLGTVTAGLRTPPLALGEESPLRLGAAVNAGHTFIKTRRSIVECVDCHDQDLEIGAGNFLEPAVYVTRGRGGLNARYRMYAGDANWENALVVGYTWSLRPGAKAPGEAPAEQPAGR